MRVGKKQLQRLVRLVSELKKNNYPNIKSFTRLLNKEAIDSGVFRACCEKTVQRDIQTLRDDFNAPIDFDPERNGYHLLHHGWDFACPLVEEREALAAVLGARLAENIFPEPIRSEIRESVDFLLTNNNPDFLDTAIVKSLVIATGLRLPPAPDIFLAVFEAWKTHHTLLVSYEGAKGRSEREIEPHVLVFHDAVWYTKAFCRLRKEFRLFALHRVASAKPTGHTFEPDQKLIKSMEAGALFDYEDILRDVRIACRDTIRQFVLMKPLHPDQAILDSEPGFFELRIPAAPERELVQWILRQAGEAKALSPTSLSIKVGEAASRIAADHPV